MVVPKNLVTARVLLVDDEPPQLDLRAWAQQELGLPLAIENDARMALIGEWRQGAGRGSEGFGRGGARTDGRDSGAKEDGT